MPANRPVIVLITGMSGVGKSSTLDELARRGWHTIDTDRGPWQVPGPDGDMIWHKPRIATLLASVTPGDRLALAATVRNQGVFRHQFAATVLLTAPLDVMLNRVSTRTSNPFGSTDAERQTIAQDTEHIVPLLRPTADLELDTATRSVAEVTDCIEAFLRSR
ncbi:MAG: RNase adapter RapZ [Thermomicrobiales bacterium]